MLAQWRLKMKYDSASELSSSNTSSQSPIESETQQPTPLMRAEAIKREYYAKLDGMVAEYQHEIAQVLRGGFSPKYVLAEIDGYTWRLLLRLEKHRELSMTRAAEADTKRNRRKLRTRS
jgi:hypothetical protein